MLLRSYTKHGSNVVRVGFCQETVFVRDHNMNTNTVEIFPLEVCKAVRGCAKGKYQVNLLNDYESWDGRSVKRAGRGRKYYASRANLVSRIVRALRPLGWQASLEWHKSTLELVLTDPTGAKGVW